MGELETSAEELQVPDLVRMALTVLPVEQSHEKARDIRPTKLWSSASWTQRCQLGEC